VISIALNLQLHISLTARPQIQD